MDNRVSRWTVGLFAGLRALIPLVPGFLTRALVKSKWHMDEETADAIGAAVGIFIKTVYSVVFAKDILIK